METQAQSSGYVIKSQKPLTELAFRLQGTLGEPTNPPPLQEAIGVVLNWVALKHYATLPSIAWEGKSFQVGEHGSEAKAERLHNEWAMRLQQPDAGYRKKPAVSGRVWISDVWLGQNEASLDFCVRALCTSLVSCNVPVPRMRPKLIIDLDERFGIRAGGHAVTARRLSALKEFRELERFAKDLGRVLPIVIVSEFEPDQRSGYTGAFGEMMDLYAQRLRGLAHLYAQQASARELCETFMPYPWSVYRGGVRLYMPGFSPDRDAEHMHPLFVGRKVAKCQHGELSGPEAMAKVLQERCIKTATDLALREPFPQFFKDLEAAALRSLDGFEDAPEALTQKTAKLQRLLTLEAEQREELEAQLKQSQRDNARIASKLEELRVENEKLRHDNSELRVERQKLRSQLDSKDRTSSYRHLVAWCAENLADRLELISRAERELEDAAYQDIGLVASALDMLADEGRDFFLGRPEARRKLDERLTELGLKMDRSGTPSSLGQYGGQYWVKYPEGSAHSRLLEWHLKKGVDHDPRLCLRIYFFFDEDSERVIVGSLPKHLKTSLS